MGIFSSDEEPTWSDVFKLQDKLKRLQEENEELKAKVKTLDKMTGIFSARLAEKYKQALEEIKEKLKKYDANIGDTIIANPIQDCYDTYKLINEVLK